MGLLVLFDILDVKDFNNRCNKRYSFITFSKIQT